MMQWVLAIITTAVIIFTYNTTSPVIYELYQITNASVTYDPLAQARVDFIYFTLWPFWPKLFVFLTWVFAFAYTLRKEYTYQEYEEV